MPIITVLHYDAFASAKNKGNPAGIVLDANELTTQDMQTIAKLVGFNETVFVRRSDHADIRLSYFTPGHEINLCVHATIASTYCLRTRNLLHHNELRTIETNVGVLPISFETSDKGLQITMKQDKASFMSFNSSLHMLAACLGVEESDIDTSKPIVYGSTGTWTLLVPMKSLACFEKMNPHNAMFPDVLLELPKASIHPFCMETIDTGAFMHARHFSSPFSGTVEDAVTGTASGVMGAYYLTYLDQEADTASFVVEQGQEIGRDGRVHVRASRHGDDMEVYISGSAVFIREFDLTYD